MCGQINIPACGSQGGQISHGGFAARYDDQSGVARNGLAGIEEVERYSGLLAKRIKIIEIGDARQAQHTDFETGRFGRRHLLQRQSIFGWKFMRFIEMRHNAKAGEIETIYEKASPFIKKVWISMELVDDESFYTVLIG